MKELLEYDLFKKIIEEYYNKIIMNNMSGFDSMKYACLDRYLTVDKDTLSEFLIYSFNLWKNNLKSIPDETVEVIKSKDEKIIDVLNYYSNLDDVKDIKELKKIIAKESKYSLLIKYKIEPISISETFEIVTSFKPINYDTVIILPKIKQDNLEMYKILYSELLNEDIPVAIENNIIYVNKNYVEILRRKIINIDNKNSNKWIFESSHMPFFERYDCMNIVYTDDFDEYINNRILALEHALILSIKYQLSEAIKIYQANLENDDTKVRLIQSFCRMIKEDIAKLKNDLMLQEMEKKKELGVSYIPSERYTEMEGIYKYPTQFKKSIDGYIDEVFKNILIPETINKQNIFMYDGKELEYFSSSQLKYIRYAVPYFMDISSQDLYNKLLNIFTLRAKKYGIDLEEINNSISRDDKNFEIELEHTAEEKSSKLNENNLDNQTFKIDVICDNINLVFEILSNNIVDTDDSKVNLMKINIYNKQSEVVENLIYNNCYISIDKNILIGSDDVSNRIKAIIVNRIFDKERMTEIIRQRAGFIGIFEYDKETQKLRAYSNMSIIEKIRKGEI